jgi:hydroxyethylthiazole kinase-like uncharacterized protein yjeF
MDSMTPICDVTAIRALEAAACDAPLMERAGTAAAGDARLLVPRTADPIAVFAGPGNNGGDAFVVARYLASWGYPVSVVFDGDPARLPADARAAFDRWRSGGGTPMASPPSLGDCALVIDGLFGIGLGRPIDGRYAEWIGAINRSGAEVLALDIPSGLDADTGSAHGPVVEATNTATFLALKPGLVTGDGVEYAGRVRVHDLGLDPRDRGVAHGVLVDWAAARHWLPVRRRNAHKGTFGTLAIIGGANGMTGAPLLAGRAALYAGAGKIMLGLIGDAPFPADVTHPELMLRNADELLRGDPTAIVVGPGLGQSRHAADVLARTLPRAVPLVLDADALNLLALEPALGARVASRKAPSLMTPHPAEAARLLQTSTGVVQGDRVAAAKAIATRYHACVALKGAGTVCAAPDGTWSINATGNPGLASGGTGDVLAGIVGAFVAGGSDSWRALQAGVSVHGAAADLLAAEGTGPIGLTASELAPAVRRLLNG